MSGNLQKKLEVLQTKEVIIVDPRQTYLDGLVDLDRICQGAVLYPGTRLLGARTFVAPGAKVGTEGPAVLRNVVVGEDAEVASGYLEESVLLRAARVGASAHIRSGTLLEEEASVAHSVGLKHTILMSFVTLGSLINFCDGLISGGTSRRDHTEIGSGFVHFNFTPWGRSGDKATPSLVGDVARGVFLREPRVFLGGLSGLAGPQKIGFGSLTIAGQVIRKEVPSHRMTGEVQRRVDKGFRVGYLDPPKRRMELNVNYIGQLMALKAWYSEVRLKRIPRISGLSHIRVATKEAIKLLEMCIDERIRRLQEFLKERRVAPPVLATETPPCPLQIEAMAPYVDHLIWVSELSDETVQQGISWLLAIARSALAVDTRV